MEFKVIKLDRKRNNVVLSRRAVVEASMGEERAKLMETLHEGAIVNGVVKNITEYGAFVDLGGIDGLLHITDMAWRRVRHPSEVVQVGQELHGQGAEVRRREEPRLAGHQAARRRPVAWRVAPLPATARACSARSPTSPTTARSSRSSPASKAWCTSPKWTGPTRTSRRPRSSPLGDEVEVMVLEIDEDKRRISLGMKQCKANPWEEFAATVKRGDRVKGPVKSITDFGVFVGLAAGIDGLVHLSDLSWNEPGEAAVRNYKKGQEVEAIVLAVDVERERISPGHQAARRRPVHHLHHGQRPRRAGHRQGQDGRRARRRDPAERRRHRLPARLRNQPRPRRRRAQRAEGRRRSLRP